MGARWQADSGHRFRNGTDFAHDGAAFPEAEVVGIDMDADACGQARENVMASPFRDRVEIECCRLQDFGGTSEAAEALETAEDLKSAGVFDAIVSNPPFFVDSLKIRTVRGRWRDIRTVFRSAICLRV